MLALRTHALALSITSTVVAPRRNTEGVNPNNTDVENTLACEGDAATIEAMDETGSPNFSAGGGQQLLKHGCCICRSADGRLAV